MRLARLIVVAAVALCVVGCARRYPPPYAGLRQGGDIDSYTYGVYAGRPASGRYQASRAVAPPVVTGPSYAEAAAAQAAGAPLPPVTGPAVAPAIVAPVVVPVAAVAPPDAPYMLDAGDKLRITVFGQDGLTNAYPVGAGGAIAMPLIGSVTARGQTTAQLTATITSRLRAGFIREPSVTVEIEAYRPFFILGEVTFPGQYPFVANMTVETAVAIAGGFSPRAQRGKVDITRATPEGPYRFSVPTNTPVRPGDTIAIAERWF